MSLERPFDTTTVFSQQERDAIRLWALETGHQLSEWANYPTANFLPYLARVQTGEILQAGTILQDGTVVATRKPSWGWIALAIIVLVVLGKQK